MVAAETSWTLVQAAASGEPHAACQFAETYLGLVRAFLLQRWRGTANLHEVDDAVQEVFLDLFRSGGALARLDRARQSKFKSFLFGVARNVALRHEDRTALGFRRRTDAPSTLSSLPSRDVSMSRHFDIAWAKRLVAKAAERQRAFAVSAGPAALRRVEILELRFREGLPIRSIAVRLGESADRVHREFAKAREEFKQALREEVALHCGGAPGTVEEECRNLIALLS